MKHQLKLLALAICLSPIVVPLIAFAETLNVELIIEQHLFYPSKIVIPANTKVKLIIENKDETPEEFDSFDLNREKVIFPGRKSVIFIGPLDEGEYHFFGEYNPNTALGSVVVISKSKFLKQQGGVDVN